MMEAKANSCRIYYSLGKVNPRPYISRLVSHSSSIASRGIYLLGLVWRLQVYICHNPSTLSSICRWTPWDSHDHSGLQPMLVEIPYQVQVWRTEFSLRHHPQSRGDCSHGGHLDELNDLAIVVHQRMAVSCKIPFYKLPFSLEASSHY